MTTLANRTEQIYTELKFMDRMTPGRTPWQTLRKQAEELAAKELLPITAENRNLSRAW